MKFKPAITSLLVTFSQAFSQFIILITIAKYFTTENVGEFSFVNSIILPITILFSCGLRQAYIVNSDDYGFKTFLLLKTAGLTASFLLGGMIVGIFNIELLYVYSMAFIVRSVHMFMELMVAIYQTQEKLVRISISQFFRYVLTTLAFVFSIHLFNDFNISIFIYAASNLLIFLLVEYKTIINMLNIDNHRINVLSAFKKFFILGVANFTNSIQSNSSRFLLGILGSSYLLGLFLFHIKFIICLLWFLHRHQIFI